MGVRSHSFEVPRNDSKIIFCTILAAFPSHQLLKPPLLSPVLFSTGVWQPFSHALFVPHFFLLGRPSLTTLHNATTSSTEILLLNQSLPLRRGNQTISSCRFLAFGSGWFLGRNGVPVLKGEALQATKNGATMGSFGPRSRPWTVDPTPSEPAAAASAGDARDDASSLKNFGTSMDAISFGFAATAVLISMFLLMAIFEHLIKDRASPLGSQDGIIGSARRRRHSHGRLPDKLRNSLKVEPMTAADLSVLMPGQRYPTYLAQPVPLPSCPREGVQWPPHDHHSFAPPCDSNFTY